MKAWGRVKGNKNLDDLNAKAANGTALQDKGRKMDKNSTMEKEKEAKLKSQAVGHGLYGAFRMALKAGKEAGQALGPVGAAVGVLCSLADNMLDNMEKVELNNVIVGHLSSRIRRQLPTLQALKKTLEKRKENTDGRLAGQLLPHIENLGEVYIRVHEKVLEWSGTGKASLIMRMLSSQEYYDDFVHLETIVTSCMCDLSTCISANQLLGEGYKPEERDEEAVKRQVRDAIKEDMQVAMRDILEAEVVCGGSLDTAQVESRAAKMFKEYGLDYKELKRKERKRWRQDKLKDLVIPWADIKQVAQVAQSATSRVLRCTWQRHTVAVKEYLGQADESLKEVVEREGYIMSLLRHPNILQIYGVVSEDGKGDKTKPSERHYGLVVEFHQEGSLQSLIEKSRALLDKGDDDPLPVKRRVELALQTARGMSYLHGRSIEPIVHSNLRPSNVLIANNGRAVICDFGAAMFTGGATMTMAPQPSFAANNYAVYTAPEVMQLLLDRKKLPPSVDVFSFGVVMFELMTLQPAFAGFANDVVDYTAKFSQGKRPTIPPELPPVLQFCIQQCWQQDPNRRPTFPMIVDMLTNVAASLA